MSIHRQKAAKFFALLSLVFLIAGCEEPKSGSDKTTSSSKATNEQPVRLEPLNKELRVIGDGEIVAPNITVDEIERVPPLQSAAQKNAAQTALKKIEPSVFARPLVISINELKSGDTTIQLANIFGPMPSDKCSSIEGEWPCGNIAKSSLQRFIRARSISCHAAEEENDQSNSPFVGNCAIGKTDIATWLVTQGWAKTDLPKLLPLMEQAKQAKRGLWRE